MPFYTLSGRFERELAKKAKKDSALCGEIEETLRRFGQTPVPSSLDFKPLMGTQGRYSIRIPKRKGWRIIFRKLEQGDTSVYEAIDFGNHDIRREGK